MRGVQIESLMGNCAVAYGLILLMLMLVTKQIRETHLRA